VIREFLKKLIVRKDLTGIEAEEMLRLMLNEETTDAQVAALLIALIHKGETVEEIVGFARAIRKMYQPIHSNNPQLLDIAGTGGDRDTFNISTAAAFVIAGAGLAVAKHGNYAVTSSCGSAEVLNELGVRIDTPTEVAQRCLDEVGICFVCEPLFHPHMSRMTRIRREIGVRTVFNLLGPLTNPARATHHLVGVFHESLTDVLAQALRELGSEHAWVVHGADGLDEITLSATTRVSEVKNGHISTFYLAPGEINENQTANDSITGGDSRQNARILMEVLQGDKNPARMLVAVNAAAGLYIADKTNDLSSGVQMALESIDNGSALRKLEQLRDFTQKSVS
jgi:anthranilate phosphoribosyltransferase